MKSGYVVLTHDAGSKEDVDPGDPAAIAAFMRRAREKRKVSTELAVNVGAAWARCICARFGWEWRWVALEEIENYAIVSPDGAYAIFPLVLCRDVLGGQSPSPHRRCAGHLQRFVDPLLVELPDQLLERHLFEPLRLRQERPPSEITPP